MTEITSENTQAGGQEENNAQKPMTPAERKKYIQELKAKKEAERKAQIKAEKEEKRRKKMEERGASGAKKSKAPLFVLAGLLVVGIVIFFVLKNINPEKTVIEPQVVVEDSIVAEDTISEVEEPIVEEVVPESKMPFKTPCWIVSYGSFINEKYASKNTQKLKAQGLNCGYYWIPDYNSNGNKFFKVYIGPFNTMKEAQDAMASVKGNNPNAYPLYLK